MFHKTCALFGLYISWAEWTGLTGEKTVMRKNSWIIMHSGALNTSYETFIGEGINPYCKPHLLTCLEPRFPKSMSFLIIYRCKTEENIRLKGATVYKSRNRFVFNNQSEKRPATTHTKHVQDTSHFSFFIIVPKSFMPIPDATLMLQFLTMFNFGYGEIKTCFHSEID